MFSTSLLAIVHQNEVIEDFLLVSIGGCRNSASGSALDRKWRHHSIFTDQNLHSSLLNTFLCLLPFENNAIVFLWLEIWQLGGNNGGFARISTLNVILYQCNPKRPYLGPNPIVCAIMRSSRLTRLDCRELGEERWSMVYVEESWACNSHFSAGYYNHL